MRTQDQQNKEIPHHLLPSRNIVAAMCATRIKITDNDIKSMRNQWQAMEKYNAYSEVNIPHHICQDENVFEIPFSQIGFPVQDSLEYTHQSVMVSTITEKFMFSVGDQVALHTNQNRSHDEIDAFDNETPVFETTELNSSSCEVCSISFSNARSDQHELESIAEWMSRSPECSRLQDHDSLSYSYNSFDDAFIQSQSSSNKNRKIASSCRILQLISLIESSDETVDHSWASNSEQQVLLLFKLQCESNKSAQCYSNKLIHVEQSQKRKKAPSIDLCEISEPDHDVSEVIWLQKEVSKLRIHDYYHQTPIYQLRINVNNQSDNMHIAHSSQKQLNQVVID